MNTGDFFPRFLFYSLLFHIFGFVYVVFDPFSELFPKKDIQIKSAIRVDTIGLPELKRKVDISTQLKKSTVKKQKKKSLPEKVVKKKSVVKKVVKKKKMVVKKNAAKIRQEQTQAMDKIKQLKNIEQEQSQAIHKLEAMESIEQMKRELEPPEYAGEAVSKGNVQEGEVVTDFQMLQYFTSVRAHINMYWSLPQELADKNFRAEIYTVINSEGQVLKREIIKSSGNEDFDARVLEVVNRASPLPQPPTKKIEKLLSKGVVFKFPE